LQLSKGSARPRGSLDLAGPSSSYPRRQTRLIFGLFSSKKQAEPQADLVLGADKIATPDLPPPEFMRFVRAKESDYGVSL